MYKISLLQQESGMNYSNLLRGVPVYNKYGPSYPDHIPPLTVLPELRINELPDVNEMFQVWVDEITTVSQTISNRNGTGWEQWYNEQYLSNKPIGIQATLSPTKK